MDENTTTTTTTTTLDPNSYRFSGYQLPMVQLDETGPAYVVLDPHPYYRDQPLYWQKNAFRGNEMPTYGTVTPQPPTANSGNVTPHPPSNIQTKTGMLPF